MARIRPFQALRYDADRVDLSEVIVPPYDVIAHDERENFYERDPHNAIRLELTRCPPCRTPSTAMAVNPRRRPSSSRVRPSSRSRRSLMITCSRSVSSASA